MIAAAPHLLVDHALDTWSALLGAALRCSARSSFCPMPTPTRPLTAMAVIRSAGAGLSLPRADGCTPRARPLPRLPRPAPSIPAGRPGDADGRGSARGV